MSFPYFDLDLVAGHAERVTNQAYVRCRIEASGCRRESPTVMRAHQVAARDDAVRQIAALMQAVTLNGEQTIAVATKRDLDVAGDHRDHIAGTNFAELRDGEPRHASLYVTSSGLALATPGERANRSRRRGYGECDQMFVPLDDIGAAF
jgi:hypothetical protein